MRRLQRLCGCGVTRLWRVCVRPTWRFGMGTVLVRQGYTEQGAGRRGRAQGAGAGRGAQCAGAGRESRTPARPRARTARALPGELAAVLALVVLAVLAGADRLPPPLVVAVPLHGLLEALREAPRGLPAE